MSIQEIEVAITRLPPNEVAELTAWLVAYHHNVWEAQIAADLQAGRLDALLSEVEAEYTGGHARPL